MSISGELTLRIGPLSQFNEQVNIPYKMIMLLTTEKLLERDRELFPDADTIASDSPRSISTDLSRRLPAHRNDLSTVIDLTGETEEPPVKKSKKEERGPYVPTSPAYSPNSPTYAYTSYCSLTGEYSTDKDRANELLARKPCASPCTPRQMIGRTWWKCHGYNTPCACAVKALQTTIGREDITGFV